LQFTKNTSKPSSFVCLLILTLSYYIPSTTMGRRRKGRRSSGGYINDEKHDHDEDDDHTPSSKLSTDRTNPKKEVELRRDIDTDNPAKYNLSTATDTTNAYALAVSYIVTALVIAHDAGDSLNLSKLKADASKKYGLRGIPRLSDVLQSVPRSHRTKLMPFLRSKPVRTASGVAVVAVMSKPHVS